MPPKRCQVKGKSLSAKKKKLLERRLIQISLKLDGFVYKNKPISIHEAEKYIQEITSYQKDCADDPRSLQVIEKLIRCMTSIINEHTETYGNTCTNVTLNDHDYCQSPVYLLPDEDRTQIIENIREASRNLREIDTVDLCEEDNYSNDINAAVSNLSIGDNAQNIQSDGSQSILGNIDINTLTEHTYAVSTAKNKPSVNQSRIKDLPLTVLSVDSSQSNLYTINTKEVTKSNDNIKEQSKKVTRNNAVIAKDKPVRKVRRNSTKRTCAIDNCSKTTENNNKRKKTIKKLKDKTADNAQNTQADVNKRSGNKFTENNSQNKVLKIYKNCTINDLSWLENIRYVREVSYEEYDTTFKADDGFWDNLDIPGIWNDNDFAYN